MLTQRDEGVKSFSHSSVLYNFIRALLLPLLMTEADILSHCVQCVHARVYVIVHVPMCDCYMRECYMCVTALYLHMSCFNTCSML